MQIMDFKVIHLEETESTNHWLKEHRDEDFGTGAHTALVVVADFQTAGKGCGSNTWESERGKNLLFSVMLHPRQVPATSQFILSMANALALKAALDEYIGEVKIKWPNDIYWQDRKICGTLIETTMRGNTIDSCVIGTGINVNQRLFVSDAPNPVSLSQILGREVDCEELLKGVLRKMSDYMELVEQGAWEQIRACYRAHLYRLGEIRDYWIGDRRESCKLVDVSDDGHLQLLLMSGQGAEQEMASFAFKEVQFII